MSEDSRRVADNKVHEETLNNSHRPVLIPPITVTFQTYLAPGRQPSRIVRAEATDYRGMAYSATRTGTELFDDLGALTRSAVRAITDQIVTDEIRAAEGR
jgi:hypothetical protein